jgi:exopolysaccharide biosynthesis protein
MDGREVLAPGTGPLSSAVIADSSGRVHVVAADSIDHYRRRTALASAIQSYPTVLVGDGRVPDQLLFEDRGVSHTHRDARLGIGVARDGRVLIALTRFEALNGRLDLLPFGPTIPEMAAIMGALGAAQAVLLDGGISGQLAIRESGGRVHSWRAIRQVPLGMVFAPRRVAGSPPPPEVVEGRRR